MSVQYGSDLFLVLSILLLLMILMKVIPQIKLVSLMDLNLPQRLLTKLSGHSDDFLFNFIGYGYYLERMDEPYSKMMTDPSLLTNYGLTERATTESSLAEQKTFFDLSVNYKKMTFDFSHTESERGGFLVQPPVDYSPMKRHSTNVMVEFKHDWNDKIALQTKFSYLTTNSLSFYFLNEDARYLSFGYNSDAIELEGVWGVPQISRYVALYL